MAKLKHPSRVTIPAILQRKSSSDRISALTAYDFLMAKLLDRAGVDIILVGDSLGTVVQGQTTTLPVTLDEMIYHSRCVVKAVTRALVVGDLPFMSYQHSVGRALDSAGRMMKEGGVSAVKLEGGLNARRQIQAIVDIDIPVMGHVGLTPQSYHRMGGHRMQGRSASGGPSLAAGTETRVMEDALAVEEAGAFAIVLEGIPQDLAADITKSLSIPTIGIGAGRFCDGQILVCTDMLGMDPDFCPSFVKKFADLSTSITEAASNYVEEVRTGEFGGRCSADKDKKLSRLISV